MHRGCVWGMGACDSLVILQPVFQFQASLTEGQAPPETQSSHRFWKADIHIEEVGNVTAGKAAGPALLSQDQSTPYRHKETTFHWVCSSWRHLIEWQNVSLRERWEVCPVLSFLRVHDQQGQAHTFHSQRYPAQFRDGKCGNICPC